MNNENPRDIVRWWFSIPIALLTAIPAAGRDVTIGGGISTSYEYYSREYDPEDRQTELRDVATLSEQRQNISDDKYNRFRVAPLLTLNSSSSRDQLSLRYLLGLWYDEESSDHDIDHNLSASYAYSLTQQWRLKLGESFILTDEATQDSDTAASQPENTESSQLSDNDGRRTYWRNNLTVSSDYLYLEDSTVAVGYSLGLLQNTEVADNSSYEDYVRHSGTLSVGHRFDSIWKLSVDGSYTRGLFENADESDLREDIEEATQDDDLHEFRAATLLESRTAEHHVLSLKYGFTGVDYDDARRANTNLHDATAGWVWELAKDTSFYLGGGPSYYKTEEQDGTWGYNAAMKLRYGLERGAIEFSLDRGYDIQNFTGSDDESGIREYWQTRLDFSHQLLEDLSWRLFVNYRDEDQEEVTGQRLIGTVGDAISDVIDEQFAIDTDTFNRKRLGAGTSLGYKFAQWYAVTISYNYTNQESEQVDDSYDEHRVVLSLSMEKDFLKW
jgi:hypothetical protein